MLFFLFVLIGRSRLISLCFHSCSKGWSIRLRAHHLHLRILLRTLPLSSLCFHVINASLMLPTFWRCPIWLPLHDHEGNGSGCNFQSTSSGLPFARENIDRLNHALCHQTRLDCLNCRQVFCISLQSKSSHSSASCTFRLLAFEPGGSFVRNGRFSEGIHEHISTTRDVFHLPECRG